MRNPFTILNNWIDRLLGYSAPQPVQPTSKPDSAAGEAGLKAEVAGQASKAEVVVMEQVAYLGRVTLNFLAATPSGNTPYKLTIGGYRGDLRFRSTTGRKRRVKTAQKAILKEISLTGGKTALAKRELLQDGSWVGGYARRGMVVLKNLRINVYVRIYDPSVTRPS